MNIIELTVTFYCQNPECKGKAEQTETIEIRRGQRKTLKCGYCDEVAVEIQANKKTT
jgi:aspartate carbamoyltransferase regulatory subunit